LRESASADFLGPPPAHALPPSLPPSLPPTPPPPRYPVEQAKELQKKDVSYIVKGEEVVIVDEFTGRTMPGRRWSDGLHQAVEAKEGLPIQNESLTLASVSYQAFFRGFPKLAGASCRAPEAPALLRRPLHVALRPLPSPPPSSSPLANLA